ncbi:hypothetical protein NDU88_012343 [Pleurodeles waltl]|uniref:Uncharacterized protein n=1 Tax=Pleurodeles waltl TaxID=8319 RepID=A0AAV7QZU9_PLEWA|nr:hypothetical protein NDU88_012343 [Pleurodeles waltl]
MVKAWTWSEMRDISLLLRGLPALSPRFHGAPAPPALQLPSPPRGTQPERCVAKQRGARMCANARSPHLVLLASTKALLRSKRRR